MAPPNVFISYSHDSDDHKAWVLKLATDLRNNGVDATLDVWDLSPGQDTVAFMQKGVTNADRVVLVCSKPYTDRSEAGIGGVGYERLIVTAELVQSIETKKFLPIIRANATKKIPVFLGPRLFIDFSIDDDYPVKLLDLLRELHGVPLASKPPLGQNPFSGSAPLPILTPQTGPSGNTTPGVRLLDGTWFAENETTARAGLESVGRQAAMEVRFGLHDPIGKSQTELLEGVRAAEIKTFGWPIGLLLESREEYRPRPTSEGIRAEVAIAERALSGEPSYDYWAARANGDFFLLQSLFEDARRPNSVFFNTRIVRVAETLMFCKRFYRRLGVLDEARLSIRISHRGLAGRELGSSSPTRYVHPRTAVEDQSQSEVAIHLSDLESDLAASVEQILAPMFVLFDFMEFPSEIYKDIVTRFEQGEAT